MTIKRVRLNENVHKRLLNIKQKSQARSINEVIQNLLDIVGEDYTNGTIKTDNKKISLIYNNGKLVEIQVTKK